LPRPAAGICNSVILAATSGGYVNLEYLGDKQYRIVWLLDQHDIYIGVLTIYRDERKS
jgi:hypothetical protein